MATGMSIREYAATSLETTLTTSPTLNNEFVARHLSENFARSQFSSHRIQWVSGAITGLYAILCLTGLVANLTVIVVMLKHRVMHNITNIFVLVLAFSDIVLCAFNMPLQAFYEIMEMTHFSTGTCRVLFAFFGLPIYVSCLTILLITVDRYRIILHPLLPRMSPTCAASLVVSTLIFSLFNAIPVAVFSRSNQAIKQAYCVEMWPSGISRLCYSFAIFILQFFLPLLVTTILSYRIYRRLENLKFRKNEVKRKKRTNKILALIVMCFAICWSPWAGYSLFCEFRIYTQMTKITINFTFVANSTDNYNHIMSSLGFPDEHTKIVDLLLKILAMGSCTINPFLYGWLNESIRSVMRRLGQALWIKTKRDSFVHQTQKISDDNYNDIKLSEHILHCPSSSFPESNNIDIHETVSNEKHGVHLLPIVHQDSVSKLTVSLMDSCPQFPAQLTQCVDKNKDSDSDLEDPNVSGSEEEVSNDEDFFHLRNVLLQNNIPRRTSLFPRLKWSQDSFSFKRKVSLV